MTTETHKHNGTEYTKKQPLEYYSDGTARCLGCDLRWLESCFMDDNYNCFDNDCIMKKA